MITEQDLCFSAIEKTFHTNPHQRHSVSEIVSKALHFLHQAEHAIEHVEYHIRNALIQGVEDGWIHWTDKGAMLTCHLTESEPSHG